MIRRIVMVMSILALGAAAHWLPAGRHETAEAQYGGTWSSFVCQTAVTNQWIRSGRSCFSSYQTTDRLQRYWAMWGDTSTTDYSGEIYTAAEGHDRCGSDPWSLRISFKERIDYDGTYGTLGSAYQGTYQDCGSRFHSYRITSWHYRKWVGGTIWDGSWNYRTW